MSRRIARALRSTLLALTAAATGLLAAGGGAAPLIPGLTVIHAQQTVDVGIVNVAFGQLPEDVDPGGSFDIGVETASGAACSGVVTFRGHPPIELEPQRASGTTCAWTVAVPPTARPGTGTIMVDVSRSGQVWRLFGVTYVRPIGGGTG